MKIEKCIFFYDLRRNKNTFSFKWKGVFFI